MEWWAVQDSNLQPADYESDALTIELTARKTKLHWNAARKSPLSG